MTHSRAQENLDAHLEPFRPFLGRTWRGEFKESTPEKPMVDVARWERALNGKAVRVLHSINDGAYGGEIVIRWDAEKDALVYHYFTTAGFMTTGTMTIAGGKITAVERVSGAGKVAEVRSISEIRADGTLVTKAEYLDKDGQPAGGREVTYRETPAAEVKFK
jgi:hypothetical protein